jgi:hypothetical protein
MTFAYPFILFSGKQEAKAYRNTLMLVDYKVIQTAVIELNWAILEQNPDGYKVRCTFLFLYQQGRIVIFSDSGDRSSQDVVLDGNGDPHSHPHLAVVIRQRLAVPTLHHRLEVTIVAFHHFSQAVAKKISFSMQNPSLESSQ